MGVLIFPNQTVSEGLTKATPAQPAAIHIHRHRRELFQRNFHSYDYKVHNKMLSPFFVNYNTKFAIQKWRGRTEICSPNRFWKSGAISLRPLRRSQKPDTT
jgi:hypothetical protein